MNLKEQTYICTLARTKSITEAARLLEISKPGLSLFVSNLEKEMGVRLFDRVGKRLIPTYICEVYVQKALKMLELKDSFDAELAGVAEDYHGRLRIGVQRFRSHKLFPEIYKYFTESYPNITLSVFESTLDPMEERLKENEIDIFFCNIYHRKPEFEYIPILQDHVMFMISPDHVLLSQVDIRQGQIPWVSLTHFKDQNFILQYRGQSIRALADQTLASYNIKPKKITEIQRIATGMKIVSMGLGVGFCPRSYVNFIQPPLPLSLFSVDLIPKTVDFAAVYRKGRELPAYTQELIQLVKTLA